MVAVFAFFQSCADQSRIAEPLNSPPVEPTPDPVTGAPRDGSTGQSIRPVLSWQCSDADGDPLTYDLYLGAEADPPLFLSSRITSCAVSSPLQYGTRYFWRVVALDGHGHSTSSQVWSFTTQVAALECGASATPTRGLPPLNVNFTGGAQFGQPPYTYRWDFGDDSTSTEQNPSHEYQLKGTYGAVHKVKDSLGNTCSNTLTIIVEGPPDCEGTASTNFGPPPLTVSFAGDASKGQPPYTYHWDFGDGTSSDLQDVSHTYLLEGDYDAVMTVTDSDGRFCTQLFRITLGPPLTCTAAANPPAGYVPLVVDFTAAAYGGRPPYTFVWTFGDGQGLNDQNPRHTYVSQGTFTAVLTVIDSRLATCTKSLRIAVLR
jgi:PKD repeat protein